jgi:hypothetical protein
MSEASFHVDELAAQARAGFSPSDSGIRNFMPEQHRNFFALLPYLFVATLDVDGWPIATLLEGERGFVESPDPLLLRVRALPEAEDPAAGTLRVGEETGVLGIDFATRRRNRANGIVQSVDTQGFSIVVTQSFGNCPQYIQRRELSRVETPPAPTPARRLDSLDAEARSLIGRADTFAVASRSRAAVGQSGGADISHRGGRPGFVLVEGNTLSIPDFRGNRYFNTLGNLLGEPRSALLFPDFETGDLLQLQGIATIDWDAPASERVEGAQRLWRFRVTQGWYRRQATTLRGTLLDYSPMTLRTGTWPR